MPEIEQDAVEEDAVEVDACDHWITYRKAACIQSGEDVMHLFNDKIVTPCGFIETFFGARLLVYERMPRLPVNEDGLIIRNQPQPQ